jgi:ribose 5-phosphate isomerase B
MDESQKTIVAFGCDHAGFDRKEAILDFLNSSGLVVMDFGTFSTESVDYPDFAHQVSKAVQKGAAQWGIVVCGSGNGVAITANKHEGIRCALCWLPELGALAHQHNNANVIALPGRYINDAQAVEIIKAYMNAVFEGGRHQRRIDKIDACG